MTGHAKAIVFSSIAIFFLTNSNLSLAKDESVDPRIQRVENGLLPPLLLNGAKPMSLPARMRHYKVPGVSIAVIENGQLAWARGYGVRDLSSQQAVNAETVFQAASISKPVSAMAALKLVESGKLALDEEVNKKLTSWKLPDNEFTAKEKVTLSRILSHRAGLTVPGFAGYKVGAPIPSLMQILDGVKPANSDPLRVDMQPQTESRYSGGGYTLMQQLMMDVSGKAYPPLMQELVLQPLAMAHSAYAQPLSGDIAINSASGHNENGKVLQGKFRVHPELAPAGLWTTPSDLAKFAIELQQSAAGKSAKVLSSKMTQRMLTSQGDEWGLGIMLEGNDDAQRFMHQGANQGYRCIIIAYKDSGQGAVVMTNGDSGGSLMQEIVRAIADAYQWKKYLPPRRSKTNVPVATLQPLVGFYQAGPDNKLSVRMNGSQLVVRGNDGWTKLFASSPTRFFSEDGFKQFDFVMNANGEAVSAVMDNNGSVGPSMLRAMETPAPFASVPFFLRGSMNNWNPSNLMTLEKENIFAVTMSLKAGKYEFKLGSADFGAIDFGGTSSDFAMKLGQPIVLLPVGKNLAFHAKQAGDYRFELNITRPLHPQFTIRKK